MADNFGKFVGATTENLGSILKTSTGIDSEFKLIKIEGGDVDDVKTALSSHPLAIQAEFKSGFSGGVLFLFKVEDINALADIFIGGPGTRSPDLTADMKDAAAEIFNQVGGGLKTQLSIDFGIPVALGPFDLRNFASEGTQGVVSFLKFGPVQIARLSMKVTTAIDSDFYLASSSIQPPKAAAEEAVSAARAQQAATADAAAGHPNLDLLMDVRLPVTIRFGATTMILRDVLKLGTGSLIELTKTENEPVELLVNEKLLARGEVVVVDGNYAIRILEVESQASRIRSLG